MYIFRAHSEATQDAARGERQVAIGADAVGVPHGGLGHLSPCGRRSAQPLLQTGPHHYKEFG